MLTNIFQRLSFYLFNPWLTFVMNFMFFGVLRYKIRNAKELRRQFIGINQEVKNQPVLICMNHLTRIDPLILDKILTSPLESFFHYSSTPWYVVEKKMVPLVGRIGNFILRWPKSILITKAGCREELTKHMRQIKLLLARGERVIIFPEGRRSLTGYVENENIHYGVGEIVQDVPGCQVLCIYMRANDQKFSCDMPAPKSTFDVSFKLLNPSTKNTGLRGMREISHQIINQLVLMEREYFARK
jgi:hypothetical protein